MMRELERHEISAAFPLMPKFDFGELVESMRKNGFDNHFPIQTYEGKILDGWHRHQAADEAGVEPLYVKFEGDYDAAVAFAARANAARRHLNTQQKAMAATTLYELCEARRKAGQDSPRQEPPSAAKDAAGGGGGFLAQPEPKSPKPNGRPPKGDETKAKIAEQMGISVSALKRAESIKRADLEAATALADGEITLAEAKRRVDAKKEAAAEAIDPVIARDQKKLKQLRELLAQAEKGVGLMAGGIKRIHEELPKSGLAYAEWTAVLNNMIDLSRRAVASFEREAEKRATKRQEEAA